MTTHVLDVDLQDNPATYEKKPPHTNTHTYAYIYTHTYAYIHKYTKTFFEMCCLGKKTHVKEHKYPKPLSALGSEKSVTVSPK